MLVVKAVAILFEILEFMIFAYVILTWFIRDRDHPIMRILGIFIDPIMQPIQMLTERLGFQTGFLDFTPLFALLALRLIKILIMSVLGGVLF